MCVGGQGVVMRHLKTMVNKGKICYADLSLPSPLQDLFVIATLLFLYRGPSLYKERVV